MSASDNSAPHYVELLVTDSMYNVIIDNHVEGPHLELFSPEEVQGVISEDAEDGTNVITSVSGDMKNIKVYQAFKGVTQSNTAANPTFFKTVETSGDSAVLTSLTDESAQAVKTILAPQTQTEIASIQSSSQSSIAFSQSDNSSIKLHKCPYCNYCASTSYNLKVHINNRHTKEVKYQCNQCHFTCYTKASLNYHLKSHNLDEYLSCSECSYKTHSKSGLLNHVKTHQKERPFKCPYCPYAAARKMTLKEHMEVLHNKRRDVYSCDQCTFKTNWARALKKHMKIHNGDSFSCSHCNFVGNEKQKLLEHETVVHNIKRNEYSCPHCSFTTDQQYKIQDHIHKRHGDDDKVLLYSCPDCDYKTKWKRLIKGHRRVHTGELFRCSKCSFATITKTRLNEHEMTHLDMSERGFACPHCPYRATRQTRLNEHITNRHYPDKKALHKCDKCDFSTLWKSYLKVHKKVHTGEVFKCSRCSYATPVRSQLLRHERSLHKIGSGRITTANNMYKCAHCPYTAARKGRLSEHIHMRHNRASNEILTCPLCSFKTIWKKSMQSHMMVHEDELFSCDACSVKCLSVEDFKKHVMSTHLENGFRCSLCIFVANNIEEFNSHLKKLHSSKENEDKSMGINYLDNRIINNNLFQCSMCDFSINSEQTFKLHKIVHVDQIIENTTKPQINLIYKKVTDGAVMPPIKRNILY